MEGSSKPVMEKHIESMHTCHECRTMHKDLYELNRHKEKEHVTNMHRCTVCEFTANSDGNLRAHMVTHNKGGLKCEICAKAYSRREELDEHIQIAHVREMFDHFVKSKSTSEQNNTNKQKFRPASTSRPYTFEERKKNGQCSYYNRNCCSYGELCRFAHQDVRPCRYQQRCRKFACQFSHQDQMSASFLGQRSQYQNWF